MKSTLCIFLIIIISCGTHPKLQPEIDKIKKIQAFFAAAIHSSDNSELALKKTCLNHLEGLYFIINEPQLMNDAGISEEIQKILPENFQQLKGYSLENIAEAIQSKPDSFFHHTQDNINKNIQGFNFKFKQLQSIELPKVGRIWTQFFHNILHNYFPDLDLKDKKRILAFMIQNFKKGDNKTQVLLNLIYASGPYFQKYLQLMGDFLEPGQDLELQKLKNGLMHIKDNLPHIPQEQIDSYLNELKKLGTKLNIQKTLGAASIGEVFLAKNQDTGEEIVVKFLRPEIKEIARRERIFFENQATLPALKESFSVIASQIDEELDYRIELEKIKQGILAYENGIHPVRVVRPISNFPHRKNFFAMEFINGKTFNKLGENKLEKITKSILWEKITRKFLQQALFAKENAFFHGDLHEGNLMVIFEPNLNLGENPARQEVEKAIEDRKIQLVLIDFGNAYSLTQEERSRLKNIFLSTAKISNSAKAFLEALLPEQNSTALKPEERIKLQTELERRVFNEKNKEKLPPQKIGEAMDIIMEEFNIPIPGFLMSFKRSLAMLHKTYTKLENPAEFIERVFQEAYLENLNDILWDDSTNSASSNFWALFERIFLEGDAATWEAENIVPLFLWTSWIPQDDYERVRQYFGSWWRYFRGK